MAEKKENIISHSMRSGLITGVLLTLCYFLSITGLYAKSISLLFFVSLLWIAIPIGCIFYFTKKFNKEVLGGNISYGSALTYGFYMFFFASMIVAMLAFIYLQLINPDYLYDQIPLTIEIFKPYLLEDHLRELEDIVSKVEVPTAGETAIHILWRFTFLGFLTSIITSFFFRRRTNNSAL
jgi:hypothetical protein